ncbi:MAG: hypothetical protein J0L82_00575 [Deltaproteobacteria bacterium]|nr:hypothetical protein [Deltaproteobacteria bacterium]
MKFLAQTFVTFASSALLLSTASMAAPQTQYGYECDADGKAVVMKYSYVSGYQMDLLTIDGKDFTYSAKVNVFRGGGTLFTIENYRAGKSMVFGLNTPSGTYYQLEGGNQYPMSCTTIKPPAQPADDRL